MKRKNYSTKGKSPLGTTANIDGIPHQLATATHNAVQAHTLAAKRNGVVLRMSIDKKDAYGVWLPKGTR